jgi:hypothetical protein
MERTLPISFRAIYALIFLCTFYTEAQVSVFNDDFSTSAGTPYTTATGPIGTSTKWSLSRSGADFGAKIDGGLLTLINDASGTANTSGWVMAAANTATFASPYNTTLAANPGMVTWTFNMRQIRTNPRGFQSGYYGDAYILAGTSGTTNVSGTGYAIILGNTGSVDPIKLVRYTAGIRTNTTMITSNTSGLTDFGTNYLSVKVTYMPTTNTWQLYLRNDGTTTFQDPASGTLASQGTLVNNTYTLTSLPLMGAYWNATTGTAQTAFFDNINVGVTTPSVTAILPSSKIAGTGAFTLTVNGLNFINGSTVRWNGSNRTTTYVSPTQLTASILASDITSAGTASITVANGAALSNAQTFTIDQAGIPTLTLSTNALGAMSTITGTASAAQTYTVSGVNLTADPVLTPPTNFEVSNNGTTYVASLTLPRTGNVLTGQPVTIYTRLRALAPAGIYSGSIDNAVSGGTTKQVAVSGTVLAAQPTTQVSGVSFTNVTSQGFTVNWTNGNGSNRIVLVRSGSAVNSNPVDATTYTAATAFAAGSEIGTGNFVVYTGTGNTVNVSGLSATTTYHIAVYEFNGTAGIENYINTSPATGNRTTLNAPIGWQIYSANTVNSITFDGTVDGVNADVFQADGFSPNNESGELNSDAWAISGFSDGNIAFGGSYTEDQDHDRGNSEGGVNLGGVYAFETSPNNFSLGIQPATSDFAPGAITLRFQNQTGSAVTSINIGYKVYVYNDEAGSSSFNFSYSSDNSTYTNVAGLNVVSTAAIDAAPGWKAYYRVVTLTGLNIASNNYYYLRWNGAAVSGTAFDEFALDDIRMVVNPTNAFVPFDGTAETFVILGNASLSADATVSSDVTFNGGRLELNGKTLAVNGTVTNTTIAGIRGSAASSIIVGGAVSPTLSFDQTTAGTTNLLNNLSVNTTAANTVAIGNPVVVNGTLTTAAGQSLNLGTNALTGTLSSINNNGTILTQNTTATPLPTGKTWGGTGTVNYNGTSAQTVVVGTYQGLTISNAAGAIAANSFTVNGILNLPTNNPTATTGSLSMGTFTLTMGGNAINTGIGDVTGIVTRNTIVANVLYTFGHTHTSILFPNVGTLPSAMSLKIVIGTAPSWRTGAILRTYDFIESGGSGTKAVIKAHYLDSELNGNNESRLVDWAYIVSSNTTLEQGRSNFSTTDNYTELTNVNVGLYFAPVFDQVRLTLDESEAGSLTWNGSVSDSWTTAANWTPNATPSDSSIVYIPNAATTLNDPTLNPTALLGAMNIEAGGIVNSGTNSQLTINNGAGAWINSGTFNAGTSTIIFTNADATVAGVTNFNNVTVNSGAALRPVTGNIMRIAGQLVNNGTLLTGAIDNIIEYTGTNQTIVSPNGAVLAGYHNLIINGAGAIFPVNLNIVGDLTLNQAVNFAGTTLSMTGSELQYISGTATPAFDNLTINNTGGQVDLNSNASVAGTLTLTAGKLNIGSNILTLGANAVSGSFDSTKMILTAATGEVRRTFSSTGSYLFPIGEAVGTIEYSPITVSVTAGGFSSAYVGVSVVDAIHPNNSSTENNISRYWKVNQSGITGAVATITANYTNADILGPENEIAGAQLNGVFNQQANPWIKYATLGSNTFTAAGATLTGGQVSAFTGIKGSAFTVMLTGYGSFCQSEPVTLTAVPTGGDMPYTYLWSAGLGTQATATPPTATVGTTNYVITVKDNNGIAATDNNDVTVLTPSAGGTVTGNQTVCAGTMPSDLTLSGQVGTILHWQSAPDMAFTDPLNISNTTVTLTGAQIGSIATTTYFRAVVQNGSCLEVYSTPIAVTIKSTTWNGTAWSNGNPDSGTAVVFAGNYTAAADFNACSITVNSGAVVIPPGFDVNLNGALAVNGGSFTLENNANLIQSTGVANTGNIVVKRNSSAIRRQDYTLWSSPVAGQNLLAFSPLTVVTPTSRFYQYNPSTNVYNSITSPGSVNFNDAQGYLIRVANNHPNFPWIWNGQFTGVAHNGNYNYNMFNGGVGFRFNLVGNPYPSPVSMSAFASANSAQITQTLYFWRETNSNTSNNAYCSWSPAGGPNGTFVSNNQEAVVDPQGVIQTGQGFFVEAGAAGSQVNFTNAMRLGNNTGQFFRPATAAQSPADAQNHRIWLNVTNATGAFCQTAFGYMENATDDYDMGIEGRYINDGDTEFYSIVGSEKLVIQGRALPFMASDIVPMGFKATTAGTYSIAIDHLDGLFGAGQEIYIKDNLTGTQQLINDGPYTFTTDAGEFTSRFEVLYQDALGTVNPALDNTVSIIKNSGAFTINSGNQAMDNVLVFDIRGRLLVELKDVNATHTSFTVNGANQVLIVKIKSVDGQQATRKVIN